MKLFNFHSIFLVSACAMLFLTSCDWSKKESENSIITHSSWGKTTVKHPDGSLHHYEDVKIWPTGSRAWDWKENNTHHVPGIQIGDVTELLDKADIIILTRGMDEVLQVPQETIDYVKDNNKTVHVLRTQDAVILFNKLSQEGKKVAGVFHSTC
jgi:hypothetical protein